LSIPFLLGFNSESRYAITTKKKNMIDECKDSGNMVIVKIKYKQTKQRSATNQFFKNALFSKRFFSVCFVNVHVNLGKITFL
jgi:hypothetical protein